LFNKFYSHTPLSIVSEASVLGFSQPFDLLCQKDQPVSIIINRIIDQDPASVSCVFTNRDNGFLEKLKLSSKTFFFHFLKGLET